MTEANVKYPIGIQTFEKLIEDKWLYVDKTEYIYKMTHRYNYVFLSRPRRFGKSLLVSTLKSYFQGRKDLFAGLVIEKLETEWKRHPVFHFNMSSAKCQEIEDAKIRLNSMICEYESIYGKSEVADTFTGRLKYLFKNAYEQTGEKIVILIDEYDSPILEVMEDPDKLKDFRNLFRTFYSPIKDCDEYIKFAFITGITKFSQLSIFSEINNLSIISMDDEYSAVCGITKDEILSNFKIGLQEFSEKENISVDTLIMRLKKQYDGYHFSENSQDIFNPFSLLSAFQKKKLDNYWFSTGTPSWLIKKMREFDFQPQDLECSVAEQTDFDAPTEGMSCALPLLYQSGYLTIKKADIRRRLFTLSVPNNEVREGLFKSLVPYYLTKRTQDSNIFISDFGWFVIDNEIPQALHLMRTFISSIPYDLLRRDEKCYHTIFFIVSRLLCKFVDSEVASSNGRSDMVLKTDTHIYVFEFKYGGKVDKALLQIEEKGYLIPYEMDGRAVVKVAVNFNEDARTIDGWAIERDGERSVEVF